ncbi:MAG: acylphosphatase [Chloroflexota bacterium]
MYRTLHASVWGRVQGVLFRDFVREHAERLGLTGYVQNLPNGSVEVGAEGENDKLEQLVRYLKIGPPAATVDRVITEWSEYRGSYSDFRIRY